MQLHINIEDISILLPVKNGMEFVPNCLANLVAMSRGGEIVIVDDSSTDGTFEYCTLFSQEHSNFHVIRNPGSGLCDALNFGVSQSTRPWIARFDVDDLYEPNRLIAQIELINGTQDTVAVFSDYIFISSAGKALGYLPTALGDFSTKLSLVSGRRTPHPSVVFSKKAFNEVGGYLKDDFPAEDLSLWLRLAHVGSFHSVGLALLKYQLHQNSITSQLRNASIRKKSDVLHKYPIDTNNFYVAIQELPNTFKFYDSQTAASKRKFLHLLDILLFSKTYRVRVPLTVYIYFFQLMARPKNFYSILTLFIESVNRRHYRKNHF